MDGKANATHTHTWSQISNVPNASTAQKGVVQLNNTLTSTSQQQALTASMGKVLNDKITQLKNVDLSDYATKAELNDKASTSEVADIKGLLIKTLDSNILLQHQFDGIADGLFGVNQTWQDKTSERQANTEYIVN